MRIHDLLTEVSGALRTLPGVTELHVFGSLAAGTSDAYSDLDLQVVTSSPDVARAALLTVLDDVGPIALDWTTTEPSGDFLPTILFANESLYHKIDLGLSAIFNPGSPETLFYGASRLLWRMDVPAAQIETKPVAAYAPKEGSAGHLIVGLLLAGIRYVKARKRGKGWTCWRFASAQTDWLATLLYEQAHGWADTGRKLTTWEYAELDSLMDKAGRERPCPEMDFSSPAAMDAAYCRLLEQAVALTCTKAGHVGEEFHVDCINRLMELIRSELRS